MIAVDLLAEHAYELATRALAGRRVAVLSAGRSSRTMLAADGVDAELVEPGRLSGSDNGAFDAVVLVRSRGEPAAAEEALDAVRRLAARGVPAVVSLPSDPGGAPSGTGYETLESLLEGARSVTVVAVRTTTGSLIAAPAHDWPAVVVSAEETTSAEPDALVAFANVEPIEPAAGFAVRSAAAPRRPLAALERSVRALERANRSLARSTGTRRASAAASTIHRSTQLERRLLHVHRESPWVTLPIRIARGLLRRARALRARFSRRANP